MTARAALVLAGAALVAGCGGNGTSPYEQEVPGPRQTGVLRIEPRALATRLEANEGLRLIDVRTPEEFAAGHIAGAENIPLARFDPAALDPADRREIVLYCRTARRSAEAADRLSRATGKPAVHMAGGIVAWKAAGLPTTR